MKAPRMVVPKVARTPTRIDDLAPYTVREYTSHPWISVPNQCTAEGMCRAADRLQSVGSFEVKIAGTAAMTRKTTIRVTDI